MDEADTRVSTVGAGGVARGVAGGLARGVAGGVAGGVARGVAGGVVSTDVGADSVSLGTAIFLVSVSNIFLTSSIVCGISTDGAVVSIPSLELEKIMTK